MARSLGVARATVVVAYDMLVAEGYARSRRGDGTFVQSVRRQSAPSEGARPAEARHPARGVIFDLRLGSPDTRLFPHDVWRRLEARSWRRVSDQVQGASDPAGLLVLRQALVGHASYARAVSCAADSIVITAGAQQGFDLLARALVAGPEIVVAVEDPGYTPARDAFARAGARIVGVPVDEEGLVVSQIPVDARVICVTPSHQFPLGVTMSSTRRTALLDHARRHDAYVIEDDYDCEYRYDGRPLDALQTLAPGRVCYVGTFSKTMLPALRLGYVVAPDALVDDLLRLRQVADGFGAPAPQHALAEFIGEGHLHRHVRRMQRVYARRRAALLEGLRAELGGRIAILPSQAGLHFSFAVRGPADWATIFREADARGVAFEHCARYSLSDRGAACAALGFGLIDESRAAGAVEQLSVLFT